MSTEPSPPSKSSWSSAEISPSDLSGAKRLISQAISIGAPAYNSGDVTECARVYEETAREISPMLPASLQTNMDGCLRDLEGLENANARAWALRKAFDATVAYEPPAVPAKSSSSSAEISPSDLSGAKRLISRAISIGAPAYNSGDVSECARVYEETAREISPMLPAPLRTNMDGCLRDLEALESADARAWALRKAFDAAVAYEPPAIPAPAGEFAGVTLEPFPAGQLPSAPLEVMDGVMGGVSSGRWVRSGATTGTFSGTTSLANNGGFASLRWRFDSGRDWSHAKGIYLRIRHSDPAVHTFNLVVKDATCERIRLTNFKTVFANPDRSDGPILIPFGLFGQMEQMGTPMGGAPPFDPSAVTEIGIMAIKPTVVGDFELTVEEWGLYS